MSFSWPEFTGLTATKMTRNDDLPRHLIPDSEWPRFLQATVAEWTAMLGTSRCHRHLSSGSSGHTKALAPQSRILETHLPRETGEGVGAASKVKCQWCVFGHRDPDIRQVERSSPTPQTSSIYTFLFIVAVLQREVSLGGLTSAFMQSDEDLADRPKGKLYASLLPGGIPLADGTWVEESSLIQLNVRSVRTCERSIRLEEDNCARH